MLCAGANKIVRVSCCRDVTVNIVIVAGANRIVGSRVLTETNLFVEDDCRQKMNFLAMEEEEKVDEVNIQAFQVAKRGGKGGDIRTECHCI